MGAAASREEKQVAGAPFIAQCFEEAEQRGFSLRGSNIWQKKRTVDTTESGCFLRRLESKNWKASNKILVKETEEGTRGGGARKGGTLKKVLGAKYG